MIRLFILTHLSFLSPLHVGQIGTSAENPWVPVDHGLPPAQAM